MKYISDGKPMAAEAIRNVLERIIARYAEWRVYGIWAAELKDSGEFLGWFALKPLPGTSEIEIGYRLLKKNWGHGYATEGATAVLAYGIRDLGLKKIVAISNPANLGSITVLKKIGMKYLGDIDYQSSTGAPKTRVSWFECESEKAEV